MTRKEALAELIAKVEAGDDKGFRAANRAVFSTPCQDFNLQLREENCRHAYKGSLDAARALHEAVLGDGYVSDGYKWCMWGSGKVSVWHVIKGWHHVGDVPDPHYHAASPARAWLLAILRALHSTEPDK